MSVQRTQTNQTNREEIIKEGLSYLKDFCNTVIYVPGVSPSLVHLAMISHVALSLYAAENQHDIREEIHKLISQLGQLTLNRSGLPNMSVDNEVDLSVSIATWYITNVALTNASSEECSIAIDTIDIIVGEPAFAKGITDTLHGVLEQFTAYNAALHNIMIRTTHPTHSQYPQPVWGGGLPQQQYQQSMIANNPYLT